jgi:hypothetical protein
METGIRTLTETDLSVLTTSKQVEYGAEGVTEDGRHFRYVSFGGTTTIPAGTFVQAQLPAAQTNSQGLTITAVGTGGQITSNLATGSTQLVITNGGTSFTQDQFAEGQMNVIVGASGSVTATYSYRIKGNTASTATNGYTTIFLVPSEPLRNITNLVPGTDTVNLLISPYSGVNSTTTTTNLPVGLAVNPVINTSSVTNYGWVQTRGSAVAIADGSTILSSSNISPSGTAGQVALTTGTRPVIGTAQAANSTATSAVPVVLTLL